MAFSSGWVLPALSGGDLDKNPACAVSLNSKFACELTRELLECFEGAMSTE